MNRAPLTPPPPWVSARLAAAGCVAAEEEAEELSAAAPSNAALHEWVSRRERGEPLAWIVGSVAFCDRRVHVWPGVYVPRPQSEQLARRAADLVPRRGAAADLCTGCGAVAVHLADQLPDAFVAGIDIDPLAVRCARANGVRAVVGDLGGPLRDTSFDVVTAVAPYVPTAEMPFLPSDVVRYEPLAALDGGRDGLGVLRRVVSAAARLLRTGGWLLTEVGGDQERPVTDLLLEVGFDGPSSWFDDDGDLRGVLARKPARRRTA